MVVITDAEKTEAIRDLTYIATEHCGQGTIASGYIGKVIALIGRISVESSVKSSSEMSPDELKVWSDALISGHEIVSRIGLKQSMAKSKGDWAIEHANNMLSDYRRFKYATH